MNFFLTIILDGLIEASWLFIVALGLTLVFGVLKILNIAHGSFYALGAYLAATAVTFVAARGLPPAIGFVVMQNTYNEGKNIGGGIGKTTNDVYGPGGSLLKGATPP